MGYPTEYLNSVPWETQSSRKSRKKLESHMTYQKKINLMTKAMERAKDADFKKIWRRKIDYLYVKRAWTHVEESIRKEGKDV
tara:strand:+ start:1149 stop:1394 length:246 start_codon:yes stop_codon:yes gene_type:complete